MARNTPPALTSYTEVASWTGTGATRVTPAAVSWSAGSIIVVIAGGESNGTFGVPTATGLTFTSRALNTTASTCGTRAASAAAAAPGSSVITVTNSNTTEQSGFAVWVFDGSDGFDAAAEQHTSTKTVSLTHTDTHSATCWGIFDFGAGAVTSVTLSPTATHTRQEAVSAGRYSFYAGDLTDHAAAGAQAYGITGGSPGTGPFSIVAVAVLGTTTGGGTTVKQLAQLGVG